MRAITATQFLSHSGHFGLARGEGRLGGETPLVSILHPHRVDASGRPRVMAVAIDAKFARGPLAAVTSALDAIFADAIPTYWIPELQVYQSPRGRVESQWLQSLHTKEGAKILTRRAITAVINEETGEDVFVVLTVNCDV